MHLLHKRKVAILINILIQLENLRTYRIFLNSQMHILKPQSLNDVDSRTTLLNKKKQDDNL